MDDVIDSLYVNYRQERENLVAGDVVDGIVIDRAVDVLRLHRIPPRVGPYYVVELPTGAWQNLMWPLERWTVLSPGLAAAHTVKPVIAVYAPHLDSDISEKNYLKTGYGLVRGENAAVRIVFSVMS